MMDSNFYKKISSEKTPFYVFDIDCVKNRIMYLKKSLPKNVILCFAMKANPFIIKEIDSYIDKFEICSYGEEQIAESMNIGHEKMVISGVYKDSYSMDKIIGNYEPGEVITIESLNQLLLLDKISKQKKVGLRVILRLTSGNQFGMTEEEIENILKERYKYKYLNIIGIQYFSGTQKTLTKRLAKEIAYLDNFLNHLRLDLGYEVEELEYGGGFPWEYFENNKSFDEQEYLEIFSNLISQMNYQGSIVLELGRSICASCGDYYTKVVDLKHNKEGNFAILDGGINHLVYYGQMMAMRHPILDIYPKRNTNKIEEWNLCGALCTINDLLVKNMPFDDLQVGDIIIFHNTGAYSMTEGISLFLSRDLPRIIFKSNSNLQVVRENVEIYKLNMPEKNMKGSDK